VIKVVFVAPAVVFSALSDALGASKNFGIYFSVKSQECTDNGHFTAKCDVATKGCTIVIHCFACDTISSVSTQYASQ